MNIPFLLNPVWYFHIYNCIKKLSPDLIFIRDLPLSFSGIFLSKMFKIPFVVDIAEHFPALMKENKKWSKNKFLAFFCFIFYTFIEKYTVTTAKNIIVVTEEQQQRMIQQYKISKDKFTIINNTPVISANTSFMYKQNKNAPLVVIYTGQIDAKFRGIETVLEAAKIVKNSNIVIKIFGGGCDEEKHKNYIETYHVNNVIITGYMPHKQLMKEIEVSDIGIIPHTNSDVIQYTMPNKIFDYISKGKPIITSDAKPLKRIVDECDCGYVFKACNSESLAKVLLYVNENKQELPLKAINGFNACKHKYNWAEDEKELLNLVNNLFKKVKLDEK